MSTPAIETTDLTKTFTVAKSTVTAVDAVNLQVPQGQLVALLGPNGAGKSTTLKMLTTLLSPTSGSARLLGLDVVRQAAAARRRFGFVGQGNGAGHMHHGRDEVIGQALAHGLGKRQAAQRADELIEALGLTEFARRQVQQLSGGQRRRFDIAIGMVSQPDVLFLDEPSTGLDPQNRAHLQELIRDLHRRTGATIVLTTHYLDEADALSERVVVIDHGRVIADDTAQSLKDALGDQITVELPDAASAARARDQLLRGHDRVQVEGQVISLRTSSGPRQALAVVDQLRAHGEQPLALTMTRSSLDDVFLDLTGRSLREAGEQPTPTPEEISA